MATGMRAVGVKETHEQVASAVIHRKQPSQPLPEIFLGDNPVYFFCNSPAKGIVNIFDTGRVRVDLLSTTHRGKNRHSLFTSVPTVLVVRYPSSIVLVDGILLRSKDDLHRHRSYSSRRYP